MLNSQSYCKQCRTYDDCRCRRRRNTAARRAARLPMELPTRAPKPAPVSEPDTRPQPLGPLAELLNIT